MVFAGFSLESSSLGCSGIYAGRKMLEADHCARNLGSLSFEGRDQLVMSSLFSGLERSSLVRRSGPLEIMSKSGLKVPGFS